jgi:hypothetical protein
LLTGLKETLIKIGAKVTRHGRYIATKAAFPARHAPALPRLLRGSPVATRCDGPGLQMPARGRQSRVNKPVIGWMPG